MITNVSYFIGNQLGVSYLGQPITKKMLSGDFPMKKLLLASAIAALSVSAQAAPTVYGKIFLTGDYKNMSGDLVTYSRTDATKNYTVSKAKSEYSKTELKSNGSRVGLKGSEPLMAGTNLKYKLEYGVKVDEDKTGQFTARDSYIALANDAMGTLQFGRFGTPEPDYANVLAGNVLGGDAILASYDADRTGNHFMYTAPSIMPDISFSASYALPDANKKDGKADGGSGNSLNGKDGVASVAATFEPSGAPFRAGASIVSNLDKTNAYRVTGAFDVSPQITVGGLYQMIDFDKDKNENTISVSGTYGLSPMMSVYAQADMVQNIGGLESSDKERYAVGTMYKLNGNTTGHLYGAYLHNDGVISEGSTSGEYNLDYVADQTDGFGIGAGIEYKF